MTRLTASIKLFLPTDSSRIEMCLNNSSDALEFIHN